jgi:WD repeat/SOCS box-containing protein 1
MDHQSILLQQNGVIKYNGKLTKLTCYDINSPMNSNSPASTSPSSSLQLPRIFNDDLQIWSCVFSPDETYFAWSTDGIIKWVEVNNSKRKFHNESKSNTANHQPFSLNDNIIHEQFENYVQKPINIKKPNKNDSNNEENISHQKEVIEIDCNENVYALAFGSSKPLLKTHQGKYKPKVNTRFSYDENEVLLLAVGLQSGRIRIYDVLHNKFLFVLFDHKSVIKGLKFSKDGSLKLASVSNDSAIKLWNMMDDGNMYKTLAGHTGKVNACDWSPKNSLLCSVGSNRQAYIWDTQTFKIIHTLKGHLHDVSTCEFSPDGGICATGSFDTRILLWCPYTGQLIKQLYHMCPPPSTIFAGGFNEHYIRYLTFSKNGDHLVSICDDK